MRTRLVVSVVALVLLASACSSSGGGSNDGGVDNGLPQNSAKGSGPASSGVRVVAGENMWGSVVAQIGGDLISLTSIITDPDQDPHEYESTVDDAATVAHARLVVVNGAGYDPFLTDLLSAHASAGRKVITVADVVDVHGDNANPHLWYRPAYVVAAARAIEAELALMLPAHTSELAANLDKFLAGEQQVSDVIAQIRGKYAGKKVAYTEPVAGYLVDDAGLKLGIPLSYTRAIEEGTDPSPLDDAEFKDALASHKVSVLLYNPQVTDTTTAELKTLANKDGVPIVGVTETLPLSQPDLQTWQAAQARELLAALGG